MATGLTPLLDSLIAENKVLLFADFRNGSLWDRINNKIYTTSRGTLKLMRGFLNSYPSSGPTYTLSEQFYATSDYTFVFVCKIAVNGMQGLNSEEGCFIQFIPYLYYREKVEGGSIHSGGTWISNNKYTSTIIRKHSAGNAYISFYQNGTLIGAADRNGGPVAAESGNPWVIQTAYNASSWGATLIIKKALTSTEVATITDELDNQLTYETNNLVINSTYPTVGSSVWEARYGLLAGETTMSAGRSLGQLDPLKVSTGTHKATTFLYNGVLAKGIKCVTAGNVILPDPRPTLGTTWAYRYYDDSAATWESRTSATATVALDAVNDIILWATADGRTCLRKY